MREGYCFWGNVTIILILCLTGAVDAKKKSKFKPVAVIEDTRRCPNAEMNAFINFTMPAKDDYRINMEFNIPELVEEEMLTNVFEKCESPTSEKCDQFLTIPVTGAKYCYFLRNFNSTSPIFQATFGDYEPPLQCPFLGTYYLRDKSIGHSVDLLVQKGSLDVLNDHKYYRWIWKFTDLRKNADVFCVQIMTSFKKVKIN